MIKPKRVLFICTGNICRSPLAEFLLQSMNESKDTPLHILSRGTATFPGRPIHPSFLKILERRGIDASSHISMPVEQKDVQEADLVLVMDQSNDDYMKRAFPEFAEKIHLLSAYVGRKGEIKDPMGQSEFAMAETAQTIENHLIELLNTISPDHHREEE